MKFTIVEIFSGHQANIYSIIMDGEEESLFENFIRENNKVFSDELVDIRNRLTVIANKTGARDQFFKINEGHPGDGICALYDDPDKKLRLYCIRYGTVAIILGGGGEKSKKIKALQEDKKLKDENYLLRKISKGITKALKDGQIKWSGDGKSILSDDGEIIIECS